MKGSAPSRRVSVCGVSVPTSQSHGPTRYRPWSVSSRAPRRRSSLARRYTVVIGSPVRRAIWARVSEVSAARIASRIANALLRTDLPASLFLPLITHRPRTELDHGSYLIGRNASAQWTAKARNSVSAASHPRGDGCRGNYAWPVRPPHSCAQGGGTRHGWAGERRQRVSTRWINDWRTYVTRHRLGAATVAGLGAAHVTTTLGRGY